ncbi:unnamed protein product [Linum trigynum]|uniref:DUF4283 domain-containing protein n=1 Tax=Linum trigynum TaxID=586398 RepID=A0AAV2E8M5_9ROSI
MAARGPPVISGVSHKPPNGWSGARKPLEGSSNLDGKSTWEIVQPKKKALALDFYVDVDNVDIGDVMAGEMETDKASSMTASAWQGGQGRRFNEILQQDNWYVVASDSKDVSQAEKEEDDVMDEETYDPKCSAIMFSAVEKIHWRREWLSAIVVKGLGRRVSYIPLARRLNLLWARNEELQISNTRNGYFLVRFSTQKDYDHATVGGRDSYERCTSRCTSGSKALIHGKQLSHR